MAQKQQAEHARLKVTYLDAEGTYLDAEGKPLPADQQEQLKREQAESDQQRVAKREVERQRYDRIARFKRQQLETRDWISFAEIIDWRSREGANGIPNEGNGQVAVSDLWQEVLAGIIFYTDDRSHILLTSEDYDLPEELLTNPSALPSAAFATRERWVAWREINSGPVRDRLLKSGWVPRHLCLKFAASVPFQPKPDWIQDHPAQSDIGKTAPTRKSPMAKRPSRNGPRLVAWLALKERFPDEQIPVDDSDTKLRKIVQTYIDRRPDTLEGRVRQEVDITTVRRAAGRRK